MSHERAEQPTRPSLHEVFHLNEMERLDGRLSQGRFQEIVKDERTTIHRVEESCNNYGEFLFVTVSRPAAQERACVTFFGLGFHEYRERWIADEWFWYRAHPQGDVTRTNVK